MLDLSVRSVVLRPQVYLGLPLSGYSCPFQKVYPKSKRIASHLGGGAYVVTPVRCFIMAHDIRLKFGNNLRRLRKRKGWTQEQLAEHADIAYKHVQRLEGKHPSPVKIDTIEKLAKAFGIRPSKLLDF